MESHELATDPGSNVPPWWPGFRGSVALVVLLLAFTVLLDAALILGLGSDVSEALLFDLALILPTIATIALLGTFLPWARISWAQIIEGEPVEPRLWLSLALSSIGALGVAIGVAAALEEMFGAITAFDESLEDTFTQSHTAVQVVALLVLAPVFEEIMFRGLLLRAQFRRGRSAGVSIFVTSLLFGLMHLHPYRIVVATLLGAHLGWWFSRTRSLWICIVGHAFINALAGYGLPALLGEGSVTADIELSRAQMLAVVVGGGALAVVGYRSGRLSPEARARYDALAGHVDPESESLPPLSRSTRPEDFE